MCVCVCVCVCVQYTVPRMPHPHTVPRYDAVFCSTVYRLFSCYSNHISVLLQKILEGHEAFNPARKWFYSAVRNVLQCLGTMVTAAFVDRSER